ncbi:hypothetical protein Tco_1161464 [Tanacetum coccineum]
MLRHLSPTIAFRRNMKVVRNDILLCREMGTPTQYLCDYWSGWVRLPRFVWSCPNFSAPAGRRFRCVSDISLLISGDAKVVCIYSLSYSTIVLFEVKEELFGDCDSRLRSIPSRISYILYICESSCLPNVAYVLPHVDNAAKGDDPKCWRPVAESFGGGTGVRVGRGGRGRRHREGNDERVDDLNGQGNNQGLGANGGVEGVNGNVEGANGGALDFSTIIAQKLQTLTAMLAQVFNEEMLENKGTGNVVLSNVLENV